MIKSKKYKIKYLIRLLDDLLKKDDNLIELIIDLNLSENKINKIIGVLK